MNNNMGAPGHMTDLPTLSDIEIQQIMEKLLADSMLGDFSDETKILQLGFKFNTYLAQSSLNEKQLLSNIDSIFTAFVRFSEDRFKNLVKTGTPEDAKSFIFLTNTFLNLLKIKKVYNTVPRQDFTGFSNNKEHTGVYQLTLPRSEDIGERDMHHGGSCHNWSIIFKQHFDKLGIKSRIIFCNPFSNHSFTLLRLKGKYYIFDPLLKVGKDMVFQISNIPGEGIKNNIFVGQNSQARILEVIDTDDEFNLEMSFEEEGKEDFNSEIESKLVAYEKISDFTSDLDARTINYILFGYRLVDDRGFEIDFNRENNREIEFAMKLGDTEDKENSIDFSISLDHNKYILKFLYNFFERKFPKGDIDEVIKHYLLKESGQENNHNELLSSLLSEEEINKLSSWLELSSNYEIFMGSFSGIKNITNFLFGNKNKELLDHFQKASQLMHKKSVLKFLLFGVLIPDLNTLTHEKDTYARKPKGEYRVSNIPVSDILSGNGTDGLAGNIGYNS